MFELPTYFILPLTGVNFKSFGKVGSTVWNLKITKINLEKRYVECEVRLANLVPSEVYKNKNFIKSSNKGRTIFLGIPELVTKTIDSFKKGKYSEIPEPIKIFLKKFSGLPQGHDFLLALDKNPKLRTKIELMVGETLPRGAELLSAPKEEWFIKEEEEVV